MMIIKCKAKHTLLIQNLMTKFRCQSKTTEVPTDMTTIRGTASLEILSYLYYFLLNANGTVKFYINDTYVR